MQTNFSALAAIFSELGGEFIAPVDELAVKVSQIKAFIFDWDGVFNDGTKDDNGSSNFSEIDSMGTNLLRFGWWLSSGEELPLMAVISGERNVRSFQLVQREHYHVAYFRAKHKIEALHHLLERHCLQPSEVAFFFDDALDLSLAEQCGVRIMVRHRGNPLFKKYVIENGLVEYITGCEGHQFAVREGCELLLGLRQVHDQAIVERQRFYPHYERYLAQRQAVASQYFTVEAGAFVEKLFEQL
jgi:3-deoxy-D-manno-octulosonate 8-phosphate phosphatase (KDO 8-P phosphatase)